MIEVKELISNILAVANSELDAPGYDERWRQLFICIYSVSRNYGGPEEGGWWYDSGRAIESIAVRICIDNGNYSISDSEKSFLNEVVDHLNNKYEFYTCYRSSLRPLGQDYSWEISIDPAEDYPAERPYYE